MELSFTFSTFPLAPDPPSNLSINVRNGKTVQLNWDPPQMGGYTKFKLRLIPLSDLGSLGQTRNFLEEEPPFVLRDLVSGASYEVQLYTIYENKESVAYISRNFTTSKYGTRPVILCGFNGNL